MTKDLRSGDFSKEVRFGDCDFSRGELMKTLIIEEKYSKGIKIGTLLFDLDRCCDRMSCCQT